MARQSDESKQGLIITLVLFVMLSMVLGLMAYLGYASARDGDEIVAKAKISEANMKAERDQAKVTAALYQLASGVGNPKEEKQYLETIGGLKNLKSDKNDKESIYEREVAKLEKKGLEFDKDTDRFKGTLFSKVTETKALFDNEAKLKADKDLALDKERKDFQRDIAAMRDAKGKAEDMLAKTKDDVDKRLKGVSDNYDAVVKEFRESIVKAEEWEKKLADLNKQKNEMEAKLVAAIKDAEIKVKKLEEKLPQIDLLAYDKPKGKITRIDINNTTAYVNLGSADLAKPGLTFSIFGVGQYRANAERKGSLEIISVIADHMSMARITDMKSATREPVVTGDELYNPAWSPGLREHVAVAGMIDLTGDGRDGTVDFVKNLEKQGVAVDAYLDTRDMSIKGKGISRQTGYLILGEIPEFQAQEAIREGDTRQERKMSINQEITKLREQAVALGVTVIPARRFMAMMGYKLPRRPATAEDWNAYTIRQAGQGGDKMMPKEMGKEGGEKMMPKKEEMKKEEKKEEK